MPAPGRLSGRGSLPRRGVRRMRLLISCLVAACVIAAPAARVATATSGQGVMCVLHAKLAAKNETTGSTSIAKGHTQCKVRQHGTSEFKAKLTNKNNDTFVA